MEENRETIQMLDLIVRPAFCVEAGVVTRVNQAAQQRMVLPGAAIRDMLSTGIDEYAEFTSGCLYLSLKIAEQVCGASVTKMDGYDVFILEQAEENGELQAMALAARELREPLSTIMTVADRLFPQVSEADGTQEQIARINRGLFQMLRVVSNMSDAARYAGTRSSYQEIREIKTVMAEIFQSAGVRIGQAGIRLNFTNLTEQIYCLIDFEKLERAVYNILSNAAKFTPKDGTIDAKFFRKGKKLYLTVQDSGSGIPANLQGSVYSRYLREPALEDSRYGIGLGMVLIRSAATIHGGTVLMEHPEGCGTRITMTMEIRQDQSGTLRSPLLRVDYAGERDHCLIELADCLPSRLYEKEKIN